MKRYARIAAAYLAVALASGLTVSIVTSLHRFDGSWGSLFLDAPLICLLVTTYALLPALAPIIIAERRGFGTARYYAGIGAAIGAVLPVLAMGRHAEWTLCLFGVPLGAAAGWLYRRIAGS